MAPLIQLDMDEIMEALLLGPSNERPRMLPTLEEEAVLLGMNQSPKRLRRLQHLPLNTQKYQSLKNQLSSLMLQVQLALHPWPQTAIVTSPRTPGEPGAELDTSAHQPLNPDSPNEWVWAYIVEREELLSWWWEFRSLCHKGSRTLSDSQVQELVRKQAAVLRHPAAQKEKSGWWSAPPSLVSLRYRDFLPLLPTRIQGPKDVQVVSHDETVALAWTLQWYTMLLGASQEYSAVLSRTFAGVSHLSLRGMTYCMPPC